MADVERIPPLHAEQVAPVTDAIGLLIPELGDTPLIGFAGAPFTLASYLVEGGPSRNHERTKALMRSAPDVWHALMGRLAEITGTFLRAQVAAGVDAVQLFDSWAGALSERDYREYVLPHSAGVLAGVAGAGVPRIHFGVGTGELLGAMAEAGADVVGVDWRVPLDEAARRTGGRVAVQGNLDPAVLFADQASIEAETRRIVAEGRLAPGHVFNLGHGVLPQTDSDVLTRLVELVHTLQP
jgi:uroporphyrinogen decarboxylase